MIKLKRIHFDIFFQIEMESNTDAENRKFIEGMIESTNDKSKIDYLNLEPLDNFIAEKGIT